MHPNEFSKRVKTYTFTNNSDSDFVDGKYRTTYGDIVGFTKKVNYVGYSPRPRRRPEAFCTKCCATATSSWR